ncbi:hypothetical protein X975_25815, partial [Stegodyphus mimosarum]
MEDTRRRIEPMDLKNNFCLAEKRLEDLENNFENNEWLANKYKDLLKDQQSKGIIEECSRDAKEYFMPHRAVVRTNKDNTKVHMVFNCSLKAKLNLSLNDYLETGPNLNPNVLDIISNFRKFKIAFCADIEKAFLMIGISKEDRKFLKFLWLSENTNEDYKKVHMTRLPFGCKSLPFILSATIKRHIKQYRNNKPECVEMLISSLYVDDLYFGGNSVEEEFKLSSEAVLILRDASMILRKLKTNSEKLRSLWMQNGLSDDDDTCISDRELKVLSLKWNLVNDEFSLDIARLMECLKSLKSTTCYVLSIAAMIFDLIGFPGPFVVRIKCLLQEIWERGIGWDEELPDDVKIKWTNWCSELMVLKYCRYLNDKGDISVSFVTSESRVVPLKKLMLPRLELTAAVIGARIGKYLGDIFKDLIDKFVYWTDSLIVLFWIKGSVKQWKQFVSNRVVEVQEKSDPRSWNHCSGKDNPANLVSRGVPAQSLLEGDHWWCGPHWLKRKNNFF